MRTGNISERRNMGRPQQETEQRGRIGSPVRPKKEDNAGASFVKNDDQTPAADVDLLALLVHSCAVRRYLSRQHHVISAR